MVGWRFESLESALELEAHFIHEFIQEPKSGPLRTACCCWQTVKKPSIIHFCRGAEECGETMTIFFWWRLVPAPEKEILFFPIFRLAKPPQTKPKFSHPEPSKRRVNSFWRIILNAPIAAMFFTYRRWVVSRWSRGHNAANVLRKLSLIELSFFECFFVIFCLFRCSVREKNWCESLLFNRVLIKSLAKRFSRCRSSIASGRKVFISAKNEEVSGVKSIKNLRNLNKELKVK